MIRRFIFPLVFLVAAFLAATAAAAQTPNVAVDPVSCLPQGENGVVWATIAPEVGGAQPRLYFRWDQDEDFYWVLMQASGQGRYWGVPPKPEDKNKAVEYYTAVVDPENRILAKSEMLTSPVRDDCTVDLDEQQHGVAENLTVGETTDEQKGEDVDGFLCDGVVSRIDPAGVLRGDERCRACVIAWNRKAVLAPIAAATGIIILGSTEDHVASPSQP